MSRRTMTGPGAGRPTPEEAAGESRERHAAELILADVSVRGLPALTHVLLAAMSGDQDAARMTVGALLRAMPGTSWWDAHDQLTRAGISEGWTVGELDAVQRSILTRSLGHLP